MSLFGYPLFSFSLRPSCCSSYYTFINYPLDGHMIHTSLRFSYETFDATCGFAIDHDLFTLAVGWRCDRLEERH